MYNTYNTYIYICSYVRFHVSVRYDKFSDFSAARLPRRQYMCVCDGTEKKNKLKQTYFGRANGKLWINEESTL